MRGSGSKKKFSFMGAFPGIGVWIFVDISGAQREK